SEPARSAGVWSGLRRDCHRIARGVSGSGVAGEPYGPYSRVARLTARGETAAAFGRRCIPAPPHRAEKRAVGAPAADCVAPPSNILDILGRRALSSGRLAVLGATPDFHHGLLELDDDGVGDPVVQALLRLTENKQVVHQV